MQGNGMPEGEEPKGVGEQAAPPPSAVPAAAEVKAFISYASQDTAIANELCGALERAGIPCWLAPRDVRPGDFYADAIVQALVTCRVLILVLSQAAIDSPHVLREIERASSKRRPVIAFRIDTAPLPPGLEYFLSASQWLDASSDPPNRQFPKLVEAVRSRVASSRTEPSPIPRGTRSKQNRKIPLLVMTTVIAGVLAYFAIDKFWPPKRVADKHEVTAASAPSASPGAAPLPFRPSPHSIAVLPFINLSGDAKQEYFSDGISEELINALSHINSLQVAARTSSFSFKGKNIDIGTIARQLQVASVLEGSIRRSRNTIRITAQLIDAANGFHIWSEDYDRNLKDVLTLQTEIATAVAQQLRATLLADEAAKIEVGGTRIPEALDAYLLGLPLSRRGDLDDYRRAADAFLKATQLDPQYAEAFAHLSLAEANAAQYMDDPTELLERARIAADKALTLAPQLAVGYLARCSVRLGFLDFSGARADAEHALELSRNDSRTQNAYGAVLATFGQLPEAIAAMRRAIELDPLDETAWVNLGQLLMAAHDFPAARRALTRGQALSPDDTYARSDVGTLDLLEGRHKDGITEFQKDSDEVGSHTGIAMVEYSRGHEQVSQQMLETLIDKHASDAPYQIAQVYAWRGEREKAFEWLARAIRQRDGGVGYITYDPLLNSLRTDPRYSAILKTLKLLD
jgi:TolB-like protein